MPSALRKLLRISVATADKSQSYIDGRSEILLYQGLQTVYLRRKLLALHYAQALALYLIDSGKGNRRTVAQQKCLLITVNFFDLAGGRLIRASGLCAPGERTF